MRSVAMSVPMSATKTKSLSRAARPPKIQLGNINFIPNDPLVVHEAPMRIAAAHAAQTGKVARLKFSNPAPSAAAYQAGTVEFLHWQSREAALAALDTFAWCAGPLSQWAAEVHGPLEVIPNAGRDLNAYYDRRSLSFFVLPIGNELICSGSSTDVVSHETGHAILDSLRPDFWDSALPEHAAFHEAFGDCMAILTALIDASIRDA